MAHALLQAADPDAGAAWEREIERRVAKISLLQSPTGGLRCYHDLVTRDLTLAEPLTPAEEGGYVAPNPETNWWRITGRRFPSGLRSPQC